MTLADLTLPLSYEEGNLYALVFDAALAQRLAEVQAEFGDPRHVPIPQQLPDGRYWLGGHILSEVGEGGILYGGFSHLDSSRFSEIEVVPIGEVVG